MVSHPVSRLPSTTELPCSDDIPVDNEDQNLLPNLLLFVLASLWAERMDWYFGVDMAIYHTTGVNPRVPVVPDAFLSLGVERRKASRDGKGRLSYATWEEDGTVPILVLEMVSQTPGGEYDEKLEIYRQLGVLYYVLYNPGHWQRDQHQPFEVYKLEAGEYQLQLGEPYWMPEVGLGLGRAQQLVGGIELEVLLWHDQQGQPYLVPEEELKQMRTQLKALQQQAEAERQRATRMADYLRSLGVDPDNLPGEGQA
ncbi:Uma2 family endonuclease [Oscillatoria sp. CS-180]|uniref:Uma2 family endonuclease n=1 Tax=Oscillatoria sp. CS-180 TaxID=3021720 RepID=UPI0023302AB0|nr:Uma2 family endonuclease [Oscillatoria sp. CS-180]MDB9527179.1 Uma2 family endonuclease [Oscillatoria sp. CS-180]